jgi:Protein of unknown function, DUF547
MAPIDVLNAGAERSPTSSPPGAAELSQAILAEAHAVGAPKQCGRLDAWTAQVRDLDPTRIDGDQARIAFWANLYNALFLHCLCLRLVHGSMLRHLRLFSKAAYEVGGRIYTLNLIEHGVLRRNRRPPLHLRRPMGDSDPRLTAAPSRLDPRIHFALNCGARSCPPIQAYAPDRLDEQLEMATRTYLQAETCVDPKRRRVTLPRLMRLYAADFGGSAEQLEFASRYLPEVADSRERQPGRMRVTYGRFDWTVAPGWSPPNRQ